VKAVVWPLSEAEAVLDRSLRMAERPTALEEGWRLAELEQRFGYGLDDLARPFDRSVKWVARRLPPGSDEGFAISPPPIAAAGDAADTMRLLTAPGRRGGNPFGRDAFSMIRSKLPADFVAQPIWRHVQDSAQDKTCRTSGRVQFLGF
jgi:hypothetical protein